MSKTLNIDCANTIVYCSRWEQCVEFYREGLGLDVTFENDWFVEFALTDSSRLSVADARRATIPSADGRGITVTLKVADIRAAHRTLRNRGLSPGEIGGHAWGAEVFYIRDPGGTRIEVWSEQPKGARSAGEAIE